MLKKKEKTCDIKVICIAASAVAIIMTAGIAAIMLILLKGKK